MKKVVSLLLVLVLALGMSSVAFAAVSVDNKKPQDDNVGFGSLADIDMGDSVDPGTDGWIFLTQDMFTGSLSNFAFASAGTDFATPLENSDGTDVGAKILLSKADAKKVAVKTKLKKGGSLLDDWGIDFPSHTVAGTTKASVARVYWEFVDPFKSNNTEGVEFEFTVYPVVDGSAWTNNGVTIVGTLKNDVTEFDADDDYVELSDGQIGKCTEYTREIEYALGEGVSVFGRGIKNAKYWGVANTNPTAAEDEIMIAKGIDTMYKINHIGLAAVATKVVLGDADPDAYVYDGNFKYLGKAGKDLPFAETYYLSAKELDIDDEIEPDEDDDDDDDFDIPVAPPVTGGDDGYPVENTNDNPSTGK